MPPSKEYLEVLKERAKKSRVYRKYQMTGLRLSELLKDEKHKALYIKLAKEYDENRLLDTARRVADKLNVKNKGAYFMRVFFGKQPAVKRKNGRNPKN